MNGSVCPFSLMFSFPLGFPSMVWGRGLFFRLDDTRSHQQPEFLSGRNWGLVCIIIIVVITKPEAYCLATPNPQGHGAAAASWLLYIIVGSHTKVPGSICIHELFTLPGSQWRWCFAVLSLTLTGGTHRWERPTEPWSDGCQQNTRMACQSRMGGRKESVFLDSPSHW